MPVSSANTWIMVTSYFVVACAAILASWKSNSRLERTFWTVVALLLALFGLAKHLQLQGEFTNWIRIEARAHYLYDQRKLAEYPFLVLVAGTALYIFLRFRDQFARCGLAMVTASLAFLLLIAFLLIRAASVHAIDPLMYKMMLGFRSGWWAELGFLVVITASALLFAGRRRSH